MAQPVLKHVYQLIDGRHCKFWVIEKVGSVCLVTFGRIGSKGQTQVKSFATESRAVAFWDKMVKEKTGKGYRRVSADLCPGAPSTLLATLTGAVPPSAGSSALKGESTTHSRFLDL